MTKWELSTDAAKDEIVALDTMFRGMGGDGYEDAIRFLNGETPTVHYKDEVRKVIAACANQGMNLKILEIRRIDPAEFD